MSTPRTPRLWPLTARKVRQRFLRPVRRARREARTELKSIARQLVAPEDTSLCAEILGLGPWHFNVAVNERLSTKVWLEAANKGLVPAGPQMSFIDAHWVGDLLRGVYPEGLQRKSLLDCGCNCGASIFTAADLGIRKSFGFDARELWIRQARFLLQHRRHSESEITFEVAELSQILQLRLEPFDITLFNGIFYHLPDPVAGLQIAADLTSEVIVVNTATKTGFEERALILSQEDPDHPLSGIHGMHWFPTGPEVLKEILNWMGFIESRCVWKADEVEHQASGIGRMLVLGARRRGLLDQLPSVG